MKKKNEEIMCVNFFDRLLHILMLNSKFNTDLGLFDGKIGIAIVYANCYRQTSNIVYYDCMCGLIDNVLAHVHKGLGLSFGNGLTGIGWGLEYLIQKKFVKGFSLDICEEIDKRIMEIDPRRLQDLSLRNGIEGLLHYVVYHLQGVLCQKGQLPFDSLYLTDLYEVCIRLLDGKTSKGLKYLLNVYKMFYETGVVDRYNVEVGDFVEYSQNKFVLDNLLTLPLGLNKGIAGIILNTIGNDNEESLYIR